MEFSVTLALSPIPPFSVAQVVAGWFHEEIPDVYPAASGFVVYLVSGKYAYMTSRRDTRRHSVTASTQTFDNEPKHLYDRGLPWEFDTEKLNASTQTAKSKANYPTGGLAASASTGGVVRIPI